MSAQAWGTSQADYPTMPTGDAFAIATSMIAKYATAPAAPGYTVHRNTDAPCTNCDLAKAWTTDPAQLMVLCDADPGCVGFVSTGYLKNVTANLKPYPGADLYVKN